MARASGWMSVDEDGSDLKTTERQLSKGMSQVIAAAGDHLRSMQLCRVANRGRETESAADTTPESRLHTPSRRHSFHTPRGDYRCCPWRARTCTLLADAGQKRVRFSQDGPGVLGVVHTKTSVAQHVAV